jgi:hypothetical protein
MIENTEVFYFPINPSICGLEQMADAEVFDWHVV